MKKSVILAACLLIGMPSFAQKEDKWDVSNPPGPHKEVKFTTDEGTWMNLDVSPDGKTIAFDLLGDIYTIPVTGGNATILRGGLPYEVQPRFSPDGKHILFTSDAGGGDNIWMMDQNGKNAKQVTKEDFRLLNNATWLPSGDYFIARKHFTSTRSLGAGEMWMYHISGGAGIQLTKRKNDQQDQNEPCVSADGKYVYFSEDMYPGGFFQYNKDPNNQIFVIKRYDLQKGETEDVVGGPGGAARPQLSHNGKLLAFVRRVRTKTELCIYNLETGDEYSLYDALSKDQQEAWTIFGVYPNFCWTPDDQTIIFWSDGKIRRVDVKTKQTGIIPFSAKVNQSVAETLKFENKVDADTFRVHVIRHARTSPDGKWLVFNALGSIWKKELPNGKPVRLSKESDIEDEPSFSPDGNNLVFVTWNDENSGAVWNLNIATGQKTKLTNTKGIFRNPSFSPDGKSVVYWLEDGNGHQGSPNGLNHGIYTISSGGGAPKLVTKNGFNPSYSKDGTRIFFEDGGGLNHLFNSINPDGTEERQLINSTYAKDFTPSPDNKWVAFTDLFKVFITPMPITGKSIELSKDTKSIPVAQVARDEGRSLHWSADSKKLHWMLGEEYFTDQLTRRFLFLEGAVDSIPPIDTLGLPVNLIAKTDKPEGSIVFKGARIITMEGDQVIEDGAILVTGNKIVSVGKSVDLKAPANAKVIDCTGKTIMPGFVDVHSHLGTFRNGISPQKQSSYYANLAYGITTTHDPSTETEITFAQSEMVKAGIMVGPRVFSTGTILYGADGDFKAVVNSLDDARSALRRTKAWGAFSVKSYNQPRRDQRQQIIQAARELKMLVVPEGGSFLNHNLTQVIDGHTGIEHNIPVAPLYKDVIELWKATKAHNTPTLIVCYGAPNGEFYWYQHTNVWEKTRLLNFMPRTVLDTRSRFRTMLPEEEYENGHILVSKSLKKMQDNGIDINMGSHGQLQGLGAHWEIWMFVQGGMSPLQALRCATMNGANYIGMDKEIGSLKAGKLADLIVMDKNPLEDIRNTEFIHYTMINGRLYDSENMNEIGNYDHKHSKFFWQLDGAANYLLNTTDMDGD